MNRITSIGLILLLSLQCFYNLGVITYFELNRDYIAEVLCINREKPITMCHGQCFLERNLDVADDKNTDKSTVPPGTQKVDLPIFLISENCFSFYKILGRISNGSRYIQSFSSSHLPKLLRPPAHTS